MADFTPSSLIDYLLGHFAESLAEAINELELDTEGTVLDSGLIDVVGLGTDQRRALESLSIRDVLAKTIPDQVSFEEERFEA